MAQGAGGIKAFLPLLVIMAFFEFMTGGVLLAPVNITNLVRQHSYIVVMALGMLCEASLDQPHQETLF